MYEVSEYVDLLLAIIAQESGGDAEKVPDIMQCSLRVVPLMILRDIILISSPKIIRLYHGIQIYPFICPAPKKCTKVIHSVEGGIMRKCRMLLYLFLLCFICSGCEGSYGYYGRADIPPLVEQWREHVEFYADMLLEPVPPYMPAFLSHIQISAPSALISLPTTPLSALQSVFCGSGPALHISTEIGRSASPAIRMAGRSAYQAADMAASAYLMLEILARLRKISALRSVNSVGVLLIPATA